MGVREIDRFLEQWQMDVRDLHRRLIPAPTPRERGRWHACGWSRRMSRSGRPSRRRTPPCRTRRGVRERGYSSPRGPFPGRCRTERRMGAEGRAGPRFHEGGLWWTRPARAMAKRPATTRQCAWRPVRACPRESGGGVDGPGGEQQLRNFGCLPGAVAAEALRAARRDLGQRAGAPRRSGA